MSTELEVQNGTEHADEIHLFSEPIAGSQDAVVAVRWCICRTVLEEIKGRNLANPHLLLVVTDSYGHERERKLVPLEQEMEYFYFQQAGRHRIQATIVWGKDLFSPYNKFLGKNRVDVVSYHEGDLLDEFYGLTPLGRGEIDVQVADELFAKKPPEWLWNWVNLWYETKPRDQCQLRRRCMLAFSVQPPVVAVFTFFVCLFRLVAAMVLRYGCGMRGIDFGPVLHPLSGESSSIWDEKDGSIFMDNGLPAWRGKNTRPLCLVFLMPAIAIPTFLLFLLLTSAFVLDIGRAAMYVAIGFAVAVLAIGVLEIVLPLIFRLTGKVSQRAKKTGHDWLEWQNFKERWHKEGEQMERVRRYDDIYGSLVCQGVPLKATLSALPKNRRTVYLRFMNLKTKVCKPFAK